MTTEDLWIDTEHGRLFARRWTPFPGDAQRLAPIVLLHDSLGCVETWRGFPEQLARTTGRTVIAYDRLGFGRSDPHPGKPSPLFIRAEAHGGFAALRGALGIDRFVLFGHSVGGGMAICCATAWPTDCQGVVTEAAQAFVEERTVVGIREAEERFRDPEQFARLTRFHGDKAEWVLRAWVDSWLSPEFRTWSLDDELRRVRCPVLVLHGDGDEYGSVSQPRRIADRTGGPSTLRLIEDCGHVPHREKCEVVLSHVAAWLAAIGAYRA